MTPKTMTNAVADALISSKQMAPLMALLKNATDETADEIGKDLCANGMVDLGLGMMQYADALRALKLIQMFPVKGAFENGTRHPALDNFNHAGCRLAEYFKNIPGVIIDDAFDFWDGKSLT